MENDDMYQELVKKFIELHQAQLKSCGLPEIYWTVLFEKLRQEVSFKILTIIFLRSINDFNQNLDI